MYHEHFSTRKTPQAESVPGKDMVKNRAGGFVFEVDDWARLERFMILGSSEPTFYASAKELTVENANAVVRCMKEDGMEVVSRIVEVSEAGRAPRNDSALFALAMCAGMGDAKTKAAALDALPRVARIGTHLFTFLTYVEAFRGWGRGLKNAVAGWYDDKPLNKLTYQVAKYRQRGGWTHRDVLRLSHPKADGLRNEVYKWIVGKTDAGGFADTEAQLLHDFEKLQKAESEKDVISILNSNRSLSWEMIPTEHLKSPRVWEVLLPNLPMTAMIRNLGRMTANGLLVPMSDGVKVVTDKLANEEALRKARVHPVSILAAMCTYSAGRGARGKLTWGPVSQIVDALDAAFYLSFGNVEPTGKRVVLALDVSGSMTGGTVAGVPGLTPRIAAAAMALVTMNVEKDYTCVAFCDRMVPLNISPRQRLDDVCRTMAGLSFGRTDCALPMMWALGYNNENTNYWNRVAKYQKTRDTIIKADAFAIYCVDAKTEILSADGWKNFDEILVGEEVYTLNHETGLAEWQAITDINVFPKETREMLLMEGRGHSSLTTLDHRWPVRNRSNSSWGRRWKTSETLNQVDYIQCAARDSGLPLESKYDDAFVEFVAWAWTEGNWNRSGALGLCQSESINPCCCQYIRESLFELFGPKHEGSMYDNRFNDIPLWTEDSPNPSGVIYWRINQSGSRQFVGLLSNPNKIISRDWLRSLSLEQLNLFIEISMIADGHQAKNRLSQKSRGRAEAFAFACILAGRPVSFCEINNDYHQGYMEIGILTRRQTSLLAHAANKDRRPCKVERVKHTGIVWCPTTPNGTWFARRNGTTYWTGNTDNESFFGSIHPFQALQQYRRETGIPAKLVTVGMTSNGFSIADPSDGGMLDCVGLSTATPNVISNFIA